MALSAYNFTILNSQPIEHTVKSNLTFTHSEHDMNSNTAELLAALKGAESALVKALPYLPADTVAIYCGEWLAEIREALIKTYNS